MQNPSIQRAALAILALLSFSGIGVPAAQDSTNGGSAALEVRVLDVQAPAAPATTTSAGAELIYRMEVISVLRSSVRVEPGDVILVRTGPSSSPAETTSPAEPPRLEAGWLGVAYLDPDPAADGPESERRFRIAAGGLSFRDIPPGPPSLRWTR